LQVSVKILATPSVDVVGREKLNIREIGWNMKSTWYRIDTSTILSIESSVEDRYFQESIKTKTIFKYLKINNNYVKTMIESHKMGFNMLLCFLLDCRY